MKIVIDAMGGDYAPDEITAAAADISEITEHEIILAGDEVRIRAALDLAGKPDAKVGILDAPDVITGEDSPVKAIRRKTDSSLVKGLEAVRDGEADLFMSAGNSGAIMSGCSLILGKIDGIDRPAFVSTYPILETGKVALVLDGGANAECKPQNLLQFAVMGSIYAQQVLNIESPTIGLLNMGTEPGKGPTFLKEAYELLTENHKNGQLPGFLGNIEARDIPIGVADVIVCDGLVGNVLLKTTEGVALSISHLLRSKLTEGVVAKVGAAFLAGKLGELKKAFDYTEHGGAPILGVKGTVIKMHGNSDKSAVKKAIAKAIPFMEHKVTERIVSSIAALG